MLCEKPLAISVPEAEGMTSAAEQAGVAHMVDFEFAYVPAFSRAKEELSTLGRLRHAVVTWCVEAYVHRQGIQSWQSDLASGGGALCYPGDSTGAPQDQGATPNKRKHETRTC